MSTSPAERGSWASGVGFVLAAAGSAVGLGNIWRFPYVTGNNGGGLFVLVYLAAIAFVGLPIMIAEIMIGRMSQRSTVGAFKSLAGPRSPWTGLGWMFVLGATAILSFYAVVAGWALHYCWLAATGAFSGRGPAEVQALFGALEADAGLNLFWLAVFMAMTVAVVVGGVRSGLERWSRILMPALFLMLLFLAVRVSTLDGFGTGIRFVFGFHADQLTGRGVLEAVGQAFFSLSVGMGGMLTYGSYLDRDDDVPGNAVSVAAVDTLIALLACVVLFPIIFTYGQEPAQGPGLIFVNLPMAFAQMPAGGLLALVFFVLLVFAALTSSISLLEVVTAYFVDEKAWSRRRATIVGGVAITILGIPSALSGSTELFGARLERIFGSDWFGLVGTVSSDWALPLGGLGMALFVGFKVAADRRRTEFLAGNRLGRFYLAWLGFLRWVVPAALVVVFLQAVGVLGGE